ncbi:hypothetical protein BDZ45DRAFT_721117 [Acephala macrosclerotiorum]|nr:hypothetical protein BDZ45DRAFT_721117 [Acephala macrosclerotiorum]
MLRRAAKRVVDKAIEVLESEDEGPSNTDHGRQRKRSGSESDADRVLWVEPAPRAIPRELGKQKVQRGPRKLARANTDKTKKGGRNGQGSPPPYVSPSTKSEATTTRGPANHVGSLQKTDGDLNDDSRGRLQKARAPAGPVPPVPPLPAQWANLKRNNVLSLDAPKPIKNQAAAKVEGIEPQGGEAGPVPRRAKSYAAEQARLKKENRAEQQEERKRKEGERKRESKERIEKQQQEAKAAAELKERQRDEKIRKRKEAEQAEKECRKIKARQAANKAAIKKAERPAAEKKKTPKKVISPLNGENIKAQQGGFIDGNGYSTELERQLGDMTRAVIEGFIQEEEWNVSQKAKKGRLEREAAAEAKKAKKLQQAQIQRNEKEALACQKKIDAQEARDAQVERAQNEAIERQKIAEEAQKAKDEKAKLAKSEKDKETLERQKIKDQQERERNERQKVKDQEERERKEALQRQKDADRQAKLEREKAEADNRARLNLEAKQAAADAKFAEAAFATLIEGFIEMTPEELAAEAEESEQQARELEDLAEANRLRELAELQRTVLHRGIGNMDRTIVEGFIETKKKKKRRGESEMVEEEEEI